MKTVEEYIISIDYPHARATCYLRSLILSCSKNIEENIAHNKLSYFYNNFLLCTLSNTQKGTELQLNWSDKLIDPFNLLSSTPNNEFKLAPITNTSQYNAYQLILLLQQVILFSTLKEVEFNKELRTVN